MIKINKIVSGIKIDTEGHEFEVVEGSKSIIENFKLRSFVRNK